MSSLAPELSLGIKPTIVPKTISDMVREVSMIDDLEAKVSKLDGFVNGLAEEMKKIVVFKRELPLCMLLLNDAIVLLKEEAKKYVGAYKQPVVEEFLPIKKESVGDEGDSSEQKEKDFNDMKNWLSSVHLWDINQIPSDSNACDQTQTVLIESKTNMGVPANRYVNEVMNQACKSRSEPGGFLNFKAQPGLTSKEEIQREAFPTTPGINDSREEESETTGLSIGGCNRMISPSASLLQLNFPSGTQPTLQQQPARKQRRSWSSELHRRFMNALEQLGGCQAATPKQIRELMEVDGLTNDEVKSHLQKYRLHARRVPPPSLTLAN